MSTESNTISDGLDLLVVHPGVGRAAYGDLAEDLVAVEPPLWARLIAGYAREHGFSVKIIDAEADRKDPTSVALDAFALRPRVVCVAAYGHQPSASTQQMDVVNEIARQIRAVSISRTIAVGGHVSALPTRTLQECEQLDYACVGEGPETVLGLLRRDAPDKIPGLVWRRRDALLVDGDNVVVNERAPLIEDLSYLRGDVWDKLPMERYRAHNWQCLGNLSRRVGYASIYTSLGCPYNCSFCCINAPFGARRYRMRAPQDVVNEVFRLYAAYGVRTFKIVDEMFVLNEGHYSAICEGLARGGAEDVDLNIWAYARVDTVRENRLDLLRRAGVQWLALGIESESAYVRDGSNKRLKRDDIAEVVRAIQAAGIRVIANYIFGLPDDDLDSMRRTLQMAMDLRTEWANFYSAMAYPGSPLYDEAVRSGWTLPTSWSGYSQHGEDTRPLDTRRVGAATVLKFRDEAFHTYFTSPRFLDDTTRKFGEDAARHVRSMTTRSIRRKLLEETFAPQQRASAQ